MDEKTLRIVNETGVSNDTKVFLGDTQLYGVAEVNVRLSANAFNRAWVTMEESTVDLVVSEDNTEIIIGAASVEYFRALGPGLTRKFAAGLFRLAEGWE